MLHLIPDQSELLFLNWGFDGESMRGEAAETFGPYLQTA